MPQDFEKMVAVYDVFPTDGPVDRSVKKYKPLMLQILGVNAAAAAATGTATTVGDGAAGAVAPAAARSPQHAAAAPAHASTSRGTPAAPGRSTGARRSGRLARVPPVDYAESSDVDSGDAQDVVALESRVRTLKEKLDASEKITKRLAEREARLWAIEASDGFVGEYEDEVEDGESEDEAAGGATGDNNMCMLCENKPPLRCIKLPCDCVKTTTCGDCIRKHYVTSYEQNPYQLAKCPSCRQSPGMLHSDYRRIRALWYVRNTDDDLEVQFNLQF